MKIKLLAVATLAALPLSLTACGGSSDKSSPDSASGTINYWLWDANQQPAYQECANAFHAKNPTITVKISQKGWDDYWNGLTTGFVSGTAPDVFTDHLSKYPEFANKHQLLPINDYVKRDAVDTNIYEPGLADLWVDPNGDRYGLPKDWDTIALFYNKKLTDAAGITTQQMDSLTWNPSDGGSYEQVIAHLTVDKNGRRGDDPGFDKSNVKTYGLWMEGSGSGVGQTQWSMYTGSEGLQLTDKNPWGSHYNYDDPTFQQTIQWWKSLADKGFMPSFKAQTGVSWNDQLAAGKVAMATNGSWMIGTVFGYKGITPAVAPTPIGPSGKRASMFNGLADSIWAGTKNKEAAWQWVKFLASPDCQQLVAKHAVVFPAIPAAVDIAQQQFKAKGVDVSAFTVQVQDKTTFLFPITDHASDIDAIMHPAMDAVLSGSAPVSSLTKANQQVNALFN